MGEIPINHLLHGARLAAGYVYVTDVATLLDVSEATYRHAERGIRTAGRNLLERSAEAFDISPAFLETGEAAMEREKLARRLGQVFNDAKPGEYESPKGYAGVLDRLRSIREAKGFSTTNAAAQAQGWNRTVYWQHETGGRGMTMDRLIAYCIAMGARPEYGVLGQQPMPEDRTVMWTERERVLKARSEIPLQLR